MKEMIADNPKENSEINVSAASRPLFLTFVVCLAFCICGLGSPERL